MPAVAELHRSAWGAMPLSATRWTFRRHADGEVDRGLQRRFEGAQIAVVDADELGVEAERAVELDLVVHFDQRVHAPLGGGVEQIARRVVADGGEDDEDAVGAPGAGFGHLVGLEHEVLAQHRQLRRAARLDQVVRARPGSSGVSVSTERQAAPPSS